VIRGQALRKDHESFCNSLKRLAVSIRIKLMKNPNTTFTTILFVFVLFCAPAAPKAFGVVPAPDGGYPNLNTAEGQNALFSLSTGAANTALGWLSLRSVTTGSFNTGVGAATLVLNTGDDNTATGAAALLLNTTGANNTANGTATLVHNSTGSDNTAVGAFALNSNTASGNTAIGSNALLNNTTGGTLENIQGIDVGPNVAVGWQALESNTVASANTAVGYQALHSFTTGPVGLERLGLCTAVGFQALANNAADGFGNSALGYQALVNNTDGAANTAIGIAALFSNTTGVANVASGGNALSQNTIGEFNTANGNSALVSNTEGSDNTAVGSGALANNITGDGNTAVGALAGSGLTGNFNTILGHDAGGGIGDATNVICIGASLPGQNVTASCYINNIFGKSSPSGMAVFVNADGKLGTSVSSKRFKEDIKPMDKASETILALQPVTFRYKKDFDPSGAAQFGLVAEQVEKLNPDLVVHDKDGKPYSVRYDQVNAMLLNEFLKEHLKNEQQEHKIREQDHKAQEQEATIAQMKKGMDALVAHIKEQDSKIQKVTDRVEMRKAAVQRVVNSQ
jgi:hypothetical protein